jgi:hypothetical protein
VDQAREVLAFGIPIAAGKGRHHTEAQGHQGQDDPHVPRSVSALEHGSETAPASATENRFSNPNGFS